MKKQLHLFLFLLLLSISCNQEEGVVNSGTGGGTTGFTVLVTSPVGGEEFNVGDIKTIKWTSNTTNRVKIELTTDAGSTWTSIATNVPNSGTYNWTPVPNTPSIKCLVRISDMNDAAVTDISDNFFSIKLVLQKSISLLKPNLSTDSLFVGKPYKIQWTSSNITSIKIDYSTNGGTSWNNITTSAIGDSGYYNWASVANAPSSQCKIKISDASVDTIYDQSEQNFPIIFTQQITIISPNGGETLSRGGAHNILWSSTDLTNVKIEYTINNGGSWVTIANSTNAAAGSYTWNPIPDVSSNQCKIKISDASDGTPSVESASSFSITSQPSITVTQPNGGDTLEVGDSYIIQWVSTIPNKPRFINEEVRSIGNSPTAIERVRIDYSTNNGSSWTMIATNVSNSGSYTWNNIPNAVTTQGRIKVSDADDGVPSDSSDGTFIIQVPPPKSLTLTSPIGGELLEATSSHTITWTSSNITFVKIEFSSNNGQSFSTVSQSVPAANGSYDWTVPSAISNKCLIRISDLSNSNLKSQSNTVFTILPSPYIAITQPNGGESLLSNGSYNIMWTSENVINVMIEYTTNNGVNWSTIVASTESDGFYIWNPIPNVLSTNCKIRISDAADGFPIDVSDNVFKILVEPQLKVTAPNGGERLLAGSNTLIQWSTILPGQPLKNNERQGRRKGFTTDDESSIANVKLEYTTNGGANWSTIVSTTANSGTYVWSPIPNANSSLCKVRVSDASDGYPIDVSDSTFVIYNQLEQSIQVITPNGGEVLASGTNFGITWLSSGVANVNLEYTTNNGVSWTMIVSGTESDGFYLWNPVPNISSTNCKIRISDAVDSIPSDMSDNTFTILPQPSVSVISPNGGENYLSGSTQLITWTSQNLDKVKIEFTTNNGAAWSVVTDSTLSIGSYSWTVPSVNSTLCRIKISDPSDGIPVDISDSTFTISDQAVQSLTLTSPNGGEQWYVGTSRSISWNSVGVDSVKIEFTTNNGQNWTTISTGTQSNGLYVWNPIPNVQSNNCKVRISDVADGFPLDLSDSIFSILQQPTISVTAPNGGERLLAGTSYSITWNSTLLEKNSFNKNENRTGGEAINFVKIELSTDEGNNWVQVAQNVLNTGTYLWNPIPTLNSSLCRIKVSDQDDGIPFDFSDSNFVIYTQPSQTIAVVSPNGGEVLNAGGNHNITWTSSGVSSVNIEYTTNNGVNWATIVDGTESDGLYSWNPIPNVATTNCKIRISDAVDSLPSATSTNTFTIVPVPSVKVISPNGGEEYTAGNSTLIKWTSANISNVKIELTSNNGASWSSITDSTLSSGTYTWTIPSVNSALCKVRISNHSNGLPIDESDSAFSITTAISQSLNVTSPNGNQIWPAGTSQSITWSSSGIDSVKIEFTSNNGQTWNTIATKTESDGFYTWNPIPNISSTNCRVKISDASDGFPVDLSDNTFTISPEPEITVLTPNGYEAWAFGSNQNITWTSTNIEKVKIEFTTNNGFSWTTIVDSTESVGSYIWTVPNANSSLCKVKISDSRDGVPFDLSDSNFTLTNQVSQNIAVTVPNGGETWESGTSQNITWSSSGIQNVKIEFTTDNGLNWTSIVDSTVSDGFYEWNNIPSLSSTLCKIKISDEDDGFPSDESDENFSIVPSASITVTYPNGGENLIAGNPYTITWTSVGVSNVLIQYSTSNGSTWDTLVISTPSDGSYQTSFSVSGTAYKIKISDAVDGNPVDESDGTFVVLPEPSVTVLSPNGGESLASGSVYDIRWNSTNLVAVKIELTTNNGASWSSLVDSTASDGSYLWTVSSVTSAACKVRVSDYDDGSPQDQSDASFSIYTQVPEAISITTPNGGETFAAGSSQAITWQSTGIDSVKIEFTSDNGQNWSTIASTTLSDGFYAWNPLPSIASTNCKIKISDGADGYPADQSDATFTISPEPGITVLAPNGGDTIVAASLYDIRWSSSSLTAVKIEYTSNNGASWNSITDSTASDGIYSWTVPSITSQLCKVRISDEDDGLPSDQSDTTFAISVITPQSLSITSPDGGEDWPAGSSQAITWTSTSMSNIKIEYSTSGGNTWTTITDSTESDGYYLWDPLPNVTSNNCLVRISDEEDGSPVDVSNNYFSIIPGSSIKVLKPNGTESISFGTFYNITWTSQNLAAVKIEYTTNNGAAWTSITDSTPSIGSYLWTVPNLNSNLCRVRISDYFDGAPSDISDTNFTITNQVIQELTLTSPNGGEQWEATSSQQITWLSTGIEKVKIEFTTNNGLAWTTISDSTESDGLYEWSIPNTAATLCKVRVSDHVDGTPLDESDSVFSVTLASSITITYPNGGENLIAGQLYTITWSSVGVTNVKIETSSDNGIQWVDLISSTPSDGSFDWSFSIPSTFTRIRISDAQDAVPSDVSDGSFTVSPEPSITVITPNGGQVLETGSLYDITWSSTNLSDVKIELTSNNGSTWTSIVDSTESDGIYTWTVPSLNSSQCKIRISDEIDALPSDVSDATFRVYSAIPETITVVAPNGGDTLSSGNPFSILWTSTGIDSVKIEYSVNNGVSFSTIVSSTPSDGQYTWFPVPSTLSNNCIVKISDTDDGFPSDVSNTVFSIIGEPLITVTQPNGGEAWISGLPRNIRWTSQNVAAVKIEYSSNNGATWNSIVDSTLSDGLYEWSAVPAIHSDQCRIKVSDEDDGFPFDISDNNFSILTSSFVRVVFPNGGNNVVGDTVFIWSSFGIDSVTLEITYDNAASGWTTLVADTPSTGAYRFRMPGHPISSNARFRVTDNNDTTIRDMSDATFNLGFVPPGLVISVKRFSQQINDERYVLSCAVEKGVEMVDIFYSSNDGETWKPILLNAKCNGELNDFVIDKIPDDMKGNVFFKVGNKDGVFGEVNVIKIE